MIKLRINLKANAIQEKNKEFFLATLKQAAVYTACAWFFLIGVNILLNIQIRGLKKKIAFIEKEWQATEPLLKERDYLLQWKDSYAEVFKFLREDIFKRDLLWVPVFKSLSSLVPEEIWFERVNLSNQVGLKKSLEIDANVGYLDNDEEKLSKINNFLEAAKKDPVLSKSFQVPDLQDVTKEKRADTEVLKIKFSLMLKK